MTLEFDVIVIGGGHNGLITAGYLAKAGLKTLVLEAKLEGGGGLRTEELFPGAYLNTCSVHHHDITERPIWKDLSLEQFGVRYIRPPIQAVSPSSDGMHAFIIYSDVDKTCKNIEKLSKKDAATYRRLNELAERGFKEFVTSLYFNPPLHRDEYRDILRRSKEMEELIPFWEEPPAKILYETFECDLIRGTLCNAVLSISAVGMNTPPVTGETIRVIRTPRREICVGGSHQLAHAQHAALMRFGGLEIDACKVERIIVKDGKAIGVKTAENSPLKGKEIMARKAIVSSLNPKLTFLELVGKDYLDKNFVKKVEKFRGTDFPLFTLLLVLKEPTKLKVSFFEPDANKALKQYIGPESLDIEARMEDDCLHGRLPIPIGSGDCLTIFDPSQSPAGYHTYFFWVNVPVGPEGRKEKWDEVRDEYTEYTIEFLRDYIPNLTDKNILFRWGQTPHDLEVWNPNMIDGDWACGAMIEEFMLKNRPLPECSDYRTPIKNLYLCGASTHPGGGIVAACGYNAAKTIFQDLGVKPENYMTIVRHPSELFK